MTNHKKNQPPKPTATTNDTPRPSAAEKRQAWTDSKMARASQDTYNVISQKAKDTSPTIHIVNTIDNHMYYLRMNAGTSNRIPLDALQKYIDRVRKAQEELNLIAAEMSHDLGREYRPPRGFINPLARKRQDRKSQKITSLEEGTHAQHPTEEMGTEQLITSTEETAVLAAA